MASAAPVGADEPPGEESPPALGEGCTADPPRPSAPFSDELDRAKSLYRIGCHNRALDMLRTLDVRRRLESVEPSLVVKALMYLGEVELVLGRRDQARVHFETLLIFDPNAKMSLLEHDPDAVSLFESTKATFQLRRPSTPLPPIPSSDLPRRPLQTYLPLGIGLHRSGDRHRARLHRSLQAFFLANSVASWAIHEVRWPSGGPANLPRDRNIAYALKSWNYGAVLGVATSYVIAQVGLTRRWRQAQREELERERVLTQAERRPLPLPPLDPG